MNIEMEYQTAVRGAGNRVYGYRAGKRRTEKCERNGAIPESV